MQNFLLLQKSNHILSNAFSSMRVSLEKVTVLQSNDNIRIMHWFYLIFFLNCDKATTFALRML